MSDDIYELLLRMPARDIEVLGYTEALWWYQWRKFHPVLAVASFLRRRNGRLMRRGQIPKQRLTYVRRSRRPLCVHAIAFELSESQKLFHEYANSVLNQLHQAMEGSGWKPLDERYKELLRPQ